MKSIQVYAPIAPISPQIWQVIEGECKNRNIYSGYMHEMYTVIRGATNRTSQCCLKNDGSRGNPDRAGFFCCPNCNVRRNPWRCGGDNEKWTCEGCLWCDGIPPPSPPCPPPPSPSPEPSPPPPPNPYLPPPFPPAP